ncbi:Uncharacterised protein [Candidatus Gugararchaeum adminiculabundum]|nr:Uncharacterised protein [Candidatus Gugararchaeum adminiculabundum]
MTCYAISVIALFGVLGARKFLHLKNPNLNSLILMLFGGSIFGVIDHLWNGQLFLVGKNWQMDMLLGFAITGFIFVSWLVVVSLTKSKAPASTSA